MKIVYDKLVRDRIPEAIEADGHTFSIDVLSLDDFIVELKRKLVEEAREALEAPSRGELINELADLHEVIESLVSAAELSPDEIEDVQSERRKRRGGFDRRIFLRYVDRAEA